MEAKWQKKWKDEWVYSTHEDSNKEKFYILDMFPYPSGAGLHVWHPKWYVASDTLARKKMLEWYSVLHPMWFDTFWLWTEQYAIDNKMKPQVVAEKNIAYYKQQLEKIWFSYDWDRSFSTAEPKYFKWTQWVFLKFYTHYYDEELDKAMPIENLEKKLSEKWLSWEDLRKAVDNERLAYVDYKPINRCPHCKTWLANEDLADWKCERCGSAVEQRPMRQWVLRITKYAERLINDLDNLDWDESMKELERNWIWRSEWTQFVMRIAENNVSSWAKAKDPGSDTPMDSSDKSSEWQNKNSQLFFEVFTTRIDTVFWMTFVVMAPEHPLVDKITTDEYKDAVEAYKQQAKFKTQLERTELQKEKTGQFTWAYAINPFNWDKIPVYIWDYVLANYGTWVVMAVPAHDERDFDFAHVHNIPIIQSIAPEDKNHPDYDAIFRNEVCYPDKWIVINSWEFSGLTSEEAIKKMQARLSDKWLGWVKRNYKIQDWVFSRQRYWGEPFPVILCPDCGVVPMDEPDLPLLLPDVENYEPTWTEEWPLADIDEWINVKCPHCWKDAKRESNTMPWWAWSSWYWLRYMDPHNDNELVSKSAENYWKNVDVYVGWAEHVTRHMIYARFWQKFLFDIWVVTQQEPFQRYEKVWLIMAEDWRKMSKRRWNVVNPDDVIVEFWADAFRTYEMFMWPFDQYISWNINWLRWTKKFLDKVVALWDKISLDAKLPADVEILFNQTIKKTTEDIDAFRFNTSIAQFMILVNAFSECDKIPTEAFEKFVILLAPFAPHLAEEFWSLLGHEFSIFRNAKWPKYDESKLSSELVKMAVQFNWKVRGTIEVSKEADQDEVMQAVKADWKLNGYLSSWEPKKVIYIPWKILNIVI